MSQSSKRELVERLRHRYLHASRKEKTKMLDEFTAVTGLHRKSAVRVLRQGYERAQAAILATVRGRSAQIFQACAKPCAITRHAIREAAFQVRENIDLSGDRH